MPNPPEQPHGPSVAVNKPTFDWTQKDKYTEWKGFRRECEMLFRGTYRQTPENERAGAVVNWMGRPGHEIVASWTEQQMTDRFANLQILCEAFEARFRPEHNEMLSEFQFRHITRSVSQSSDEYMAMVRNKARECNFAQAEDRNVKSQFIIGINDKEMQNKLLEDVKLTSTVEECLQITRNIEATRLQKDSVCPQKQFDEMTKRPKPRSYGGRSPSSRPKSGRRSPNRNNKVGRQPRKYPTQAQSSGCRRCGFHHPQKDCPAKNSTCLKCKEIGHYARRCENGPPRTRYKKVDEVEFQEYSEDEYYDDEWTPIYHELHEVRKVLKFDGITDITTLRANDFDPPGKRSRLMGCIATASNAQFTPINYKIDTGADSNLLSLRSYKKLFPKAKLDDLKKTIDARVVLEACNGSEIQQLGTCWLFLKVKGRRRRCQFYVVQGVTSILGLPDAEKLKVITAHCKPREVEDEQIPTEKMRCKNRNVDSIQAKSEEEQWKAKEKYFVENEQKATDMANSHRFELHIQHKYAAEFEGIGCLEGNVKIHLKDNASSYQAPPRRVAHALQEPLKKELDRLEKDGILVGLTADEKSEWCNSYVCQPKPAGGVRLCLDPAKLNNSIVRPIHRSPTLQDIKPKLRGAKYFSILDLRSGYWNLKLDEDSSYLTTFSTMYGRYRYTRLPFGLNCAGDLFQKKMEEVLQGLENVINIVDDILVFGFEEDGSDHDRAVEALMERAKQKNIKFGKPKCRFRVTAVPFFGELISRLGVKPDPEKVKAIQEMNAPQNKAQLMSFIGQLNYLSKFSPEMADVTKPLRELTSPKTEFNWNRTYEETFQRAKRLIKEDTRLQYYRPKEDLYIESDASKIGLGAALLQVNKQEISDDDKEEIPTKNSLRPIAYASKALTETEQRYSNIEREALAILHALEKFHHFTYGRYTKVITDHRPLLAIHKKDVATASPRLQRILMRIHQYNVSLHYRPGKEMHLADCLSRVGHQGSDTEIPGMKITIDDITAQSSIPVVSLEEIRDATAKDRTLTKVSEFVIQGWPTTASGIEDDNVRVYHTFKEEIGVIDGILVKGTRIIMPEALRPKIMNSLHYHHLGIEKTRNLARTCVYWPKLNTEIEGLINSCQECQEIRNTQKKQPMIPHELPSHVWKTVGADIFYYEKKPYLCVIDYYSKFPIIRRLEKETSADLIDTFKGIFSEHGGIVEKIVSDSGTNFTSEEFKKFARSLNIELAATSPYHHSSNGQVENCIKTIKQIYKKCEATGRDARLGMMMWRATPITGCAESPAEIFMKRKFRTFVPQMPFMRMEKNQERREDIEGIMKKRQVVMKANHDRRIVRENTPVEFKPGTNVMVQKEDGGQWRQGKIIGINDKSHHGRSFHVQLTDGRIIVRNARHLRISKIPAWAGTTLIRPPTVPVEKGKEVLPVPPVIGHSPVMPIPEMEPKKTHEDPMREAPYKTRSGRTVKLTQKMDL